MPSLVGIHILHEEKCKMIESKKLPELKNKKGAILQRDLKTFSISPHIAGGFCTPELLRKIAEVAEKYNAKFIKLTGSQRIAIIGILEEDLDNIWNEFSEFTHRKSAVGPCVRSIKMCPGTRTCKKALQDSPALGMALDQEFYGLPSPAKFKMGISGCPNCCSDSWMKDLGIFGIKDGFQITVGGKGGRKPVIGWPLITVNSIPAAIEIVRKIIAYYLKNGKERERLNGLLERVGIGRFNQEILEGNFYSFLNP